VAKIANNEALSVAMVNGAQMACCRAISAFKSVGLHVAADALALGTLAGTREDSGGLLIIGDDPWSDSTQVPADSRYLAETVAARFRGVVDGVARATGTSATIVPIDNLYDEMVSNPVLAAVYEREARRAGLDPQPGPGGTVGSLDMGTLSHLVPALHPTFGITERPTPTHTPEFTRAAAAPPAIEAAGRAAIALAGTGLAVLTEPSLLAEARAAHREAVGSWRRIDAPVITEQGGP